MSKSIKQLQRASAQKVEKEISMADFIAQNTPTRQRANPAANSAANNILLTIVILIFVFVLGFNLKLYSMTRGYSGQTINTLKKFSEFSATAEQNDTDLKKLNMTISKLNEKATQLEQANNLYKTSIDQLIKASNVMYDRVKSLETEMDKLSKKSSKK